MLTFEEAARRLPGGVAEEVARLAAQEVAGLLVPPDFEEAFYRGGNLPEQLGRLFSSINPARIDEDALEPLAARAEALIRTTYLMDDAVQAFYRALNAAGLSSGEVHVRRPGMRVAESARVLPPGTAALQALKRLWAADWSFEAVLERLDSAGNIGLEARATLVLPGPPGVPDPELAAQLGVETALVNSGGLVGLP